jgi:hypothetical protein
MLVVAKFATTRPVEVAMYPLLLFHWEMEVVAKLAVVKPVEVVRKGVEVVMILPFPSTARNAFVRPVRMVELLKVAVEFIVSPPVMVCAAVQVTLDAAVTYPTLFAHWPIEVVAKLFTVKPVEVVRKVDEFTPCQVPVQLPPVEVTPVFEIMYPFVPEATTPM